MKYSMQGDQYFFQRDDGDLPKRVGSEVAICFSYDTDMAISTTLFKHGDHDRVQQYHHDLDTKLRAGGLDDIADRHLVVGGKFSIESLNFLIDRTGVVEKFLEMNGLCLSEDPVTGKPVVSLIESKQAPKPVVRASF